jgi:hypothetical protein
MTKKPSRKKQLDKQRTEWRKKHRILNGRIILYPKKPPEHINARGSKVYNWFWKKILLQIPSEGIPAIISVIRNQINAETDHKKIRIYRTMIGMAEDAYQLKKLEGIKDYDTELQLGKKPIYDSEQGVIYRSGKIYTMDYNDDESKILLRDTEGVILDTLFSGEKNLQETLTSLRNNAYKKWNYMKKS